MENRKEISFQSPTSIIAKECFLDINCGDTHRSVSVGQDNDDTNNQNENYVRLFLTTLGFLSERENHHYVDPIANKNYKMLQYKEKQIFFVRIMQGSYKIFYIYVECGSGGKESA